MTILAENYPQGTANIADDRVLGTVHFKQVTYKITILKLSSPVPVEFHDDFIEC